MNPELTWFVMSYSYGDAALNGIETCSVALVAGVGWWYCSTISLTDRPPAKADISLFGADC